MGKHVDLIAIALLLGAAALYTGARQLSLIEVIPYKRIALSRTVLQRVQRAVSCSRSSSAIHVAPTISVSVP